MERYYIEHMGCWWVLTRRAWEHFLKQGADAYDLETIPGAHVLGARPDSVRRIRISDHYGEPTYGYVPTERNAHFRQPIDWTERDFAEELAILQQSAISAASTAGDRDLVTQAAVQ